MKCTQMATSKSEVNIIRKTLALAITLFSFFRLSSRVPVTQNDPLGALNFNTLEKENKCKESNVTEQTPDTVNSTIFKDNIFTDKPILFRGQRSATFDESIPFNSNMQRSETMPGSSVTSSLANLGSTLKFNFG